MNKLICAGIVHIDSELTPELLQKVKTTFWSALSKLSTNYEERDILVKDIGDNTISFELFRAEEGEEWGDAEQAISDFWAAFLARGAAMACIVDTGIGILGNKGNGSDVHNQ